MIMRSGDGEGLVAEVEGELLFLWVGTGRRSGVGRGAVH